MNSTEISRLLPIKEVSQITGLGKTSIYKKMNDGTFPKGRKISEGCVRWMESEIKDWIENLPKHD